MSQERKVPKVFSSLQVTDYFNPSSLNTPITNITATSYALTSVDTGKFLFLNSTSGVALTLPPVSFSSGYEYNLVVSAQSTNGTHSITKHTGDSACLLGQLTTTSTNGGVFSSTVQTSFTFGTGASISDSLNIVSNGTRWFIQGSFVASGGIFA